MSVLAQTLLDKNYVVQCRDDRKDKRRAQENGAGDPDPAYSVNLKQQYKKYGTDLREGIGFAENARAKIAQSCYGEEHGAGGEDGNVAAENHDSIFPRNFVKNGEHEEHSAQKELVGNGVEILSQQCLLMEGAGEQPVKAVAEAGNHENYESPKIVPVNQVDHDERDEDHPQQGELVWGGQNLREFHARSLDVRDPDASECALLPESFRVGTRTADGSRPVLARKR